MRRMRLNRITVLLSVVALLLPASAFAQGENAYGSFSPFSVFGIGNISAPGTAYNKMQGGVGIAARDSRFINYLNPAAISAHDTLSFMADFGIEQKNSYFRSGGLTSVSNTFNMYNFVLSFPIYRSSAFAVGITPYSDLGYNFSRHETDDDILADVGDITYSNYGEGSIYSAFLSASATFWKRLSVGVEGIYYFGNLERHNTVTYSNSAYRSVDTGTKHHLNGFTGKFGLQYQERFGKDYSFVAGATYRLGTKLGGVKDRFSYAKTSSTVDTTYFKSMDPAVSIADEIGVGISFRKEDKWALEFDYTRSDWRNTGIEGVTSVSDPDLFSASVANSYKFGFEVIPNRYDTRYYLKRATYRGGVYYNESYFTYGGHKVPEVGITLGVTLPVFRFYNSINLGIDFGQRGGFGGVGMRERYFRFVIGFSLHDIWFQKPKYN